VPAEPLIGAARYDYADCFEIRVAAPEQRSAEQFARAALEGAPWAARMTMLSAWRLLGFRVDGRSSAARILGWRIVASEPDLVHLEAASALMRGVVVARTVDPTRIVVSTFVFYEHPTAARVIWAIISPLHRWFVPYLLERAAATAPREAVVA
jgi:hypothetical protein